MAKRKPQINFQVDPAMKLLYEEAKASGHWVTRFCAAGFLLMVEDPALRLRALNRLREWEAEYDDASADELRDFVQGVQTALQRGGRAPRPAPKARARKAAARRSES